MFLIKWYKEWREANVCESCETLKQQLEIANYEKKMLLDKLTKEPEAPLPVNKEIPVSVPKMIPWNVRRQMLEREDREKAKAMRNAAQPDPTMSDEAFEKELDEASAKREAESTGAK